MEEPETKALIVVKVKEMIGNIMNEENIAALYPYSTISSTSPIADQMNIPNTFTKIKYYLPSLKTPLKNSDVVYRQIYTGTNTEYVDWNTNVLE